MTAPSRPLAQVRLAFDGTPAAGRVARAAVEFLARESGLNDDRCRSVASAFFGACRLLSKGRSPDGRGFLRCTMRAARGKLQIGLTPREGPDPDALRRLDAPRWRSIARKVSLLRWQAAGSLGVSRRGTLLIVQAQAPRPGARSGG